MKIRKMYQGSLPENKILNTSSDSQTDTYSCDYINGIIESGSNSNGSYIKYADGTMICTKKMTTTINMADMYGNSWYQASINLGNLPASFISTPEFLSVNNNGVPFAIPEYNNSATTWGNARILYPTKLTNYAVNLRAFAIGKWK